MEISLSTAANFAEIIGAGSIITGLIFGWFQLRQYRVQQRDSVASDLAQTFYNPVLADAIALVQTLPDATSLSDLREKGDEYVKAAITVTTSFETMGWLVFKRIAPFELVQDLVGGIVVTMNRKLVLVHRDLRVEQEQPSWAEWFEWLADQIGARKVKEVPAHIKYSSWKPK
jgi:hypothetical protein